MLFALSAGQKTGLAVVAGSFIVFALISALLVPRLSPDFPGSRGLRWFIVATLVFTAGTLSAVVFLAAETKEAATTTTTSGTTTTGQTVPTGNPAAGKQLFTGAGGCGACHAFTPAGAQGTIGPNLDHLAADAQKANRGTLEQYAFESIKSPDAYTVPGYAKGTMAAAIPKLTDSQIADLVAFLTQKS